MYAEVSNTSLEFSVDLPRDVPIELVQTMGQCEHKAVLTCISLYITTDSNNLPKDNFGHFMEEKS